MNDPQPDPAKNPYLASGVQGSDDASFVSGVNLVGFARVGQIITLAMVAGVVVIMVILITIMDGQDEPPKNASLILMVGAGFFAVNVVAAWIVPMVLRGKAIAAFRQNENVQPLVDPTRHRVTDSSSDPLIERDDPVVDQRAALLKPDASEKLPVELRRLMQANQNALIVGLAFLDGIAVVNLVLMLVDDSKMHLIFVVFAVVGMLAMIPTVGKLRQFIARAMQLRPTSVTGLR